MSEQQKQDTRELATMLESLPKEDRLQIRGVIAGMQLARKISSQQVYTTDAAPRPEPQT